MRAHRFHDIPISRRELLAELVDQLEPDGDGDQTRDRFVELAELLAAHYHHEFHGRLEELKAAYDPINPDHEELRLTQARDAPASSRTQPSTAEQAALGRRVRRTLAEILERGNYRRLTAADLDHALKERSLFPIDVTIDFQVFDDYVVYARGEVMRQGVVRKWLGLRKQTIDVPTYDRVCLFLRFKPAEALTDKQRKELHGEPGTTILKLFRSIPKADLEMLFPNTRLKMRLLDKLVIGVPAVVGGVPVLVKLTPALLALAILFGLERGEVNLASIVAGLGALVGLGLFLFRQWDKFKSRKLVFMKMVSENLYFRNTDNNDGVLMRLIDEAEEEECKEALLAYYFLRLEPGQTADDLDGRIERWLEQRIGLDIDFEVDDALAKLIRLELVRERDDDRFEVLSLADALTVLRQRWHGLFAEGR